MTCVTVMAHLFIRHVWLAWPNCSCDMHDCHDPFVHVAITCVTHDPFVHVTCVSPAPFVHMTLICDCCDTYVHVQCVTVMSFYNSFVHVTCVTVTVMMHLFMWHMWLQCHDHLFMWHVWVSWRICSGDMCDCNVMTHLFMWTLMTYLCFNHVNGMA